MGGIVLGTAVQLQQAALWPLGAYALLAGVAVLGLLWGRSRNAPWLRNGWCVGMLVVVCAWSVTGWRAAAFQAGAMPVQWEGRDVRVEGVISDMPQPTERGVRLRFRIDPAWQAQPLTAGVEHAETPQVALPEHVALSWYGALPPEGLHAGQRWAWTVRLKAPHGERNPHGIDWELWLWSQGIQASGYVRQPPAAAAPQWLAQTAQAPMAQWRGHVLQAMQAPAHVTPREHASWGVVQALVTGAQSRIDSADWQLFRDTGIAHLVSISGLHITMFAWLAMKLVGAVWRRLPRCCLWLPAPIAAAWVGWCMATVYAVFSGWGIPAQRTVGMLLVVVLLRTQGRAWPWPYVWLLVLTVVVALDPWSLLQAGFWLSFVAVGVLFATQPRDGRAERRHWWQAPWRLLQEQVVVGLALAPLTLLLFGQISVVGLLVNLWAIPWVTVVVTPLSMLGMVCPPLWALAAQCVSVMVVVLEWMAGWPVAVLHFAQPAVWAVCAGVCGCLWVVMPIGWRWRVLGLPLMVPLLWWRPATPAWGQMDMLALDVGQGSAVLLRTQRHSLLFDAGPRWSEHMDAGARTVVPVLHALGVQLDALMISHADSDHAGGAASVQQAFPQAWWLGAGGQPCVRGQSWHWDGVYFEVLHPLQPVLMALPAQTNASSCVLRVHSQTGQRVLLTGDIEVRQEKALLQAGVEMQADVVVVPHHGSNTSSSSAWLRAVQPSLAIAQAGYRNRYGHPAAKVVQRYQAQGVRWLATPACGAVYWSSEQPQLAHCERQLRRRYWSASEPSAIKNGAEAP